MRTLVALCLIASVAKGETYIVHDGRIYRAVLVSQPGDEVIITDSTPPRPDDPEPDPTTIAGASAKISKTHLRNEREAAVVSLSLQNAIGKPNQQVALAHNLTQSSTLFPGNEFTQWLAKIKALSGGPMTDEFLRQVDAGVKQAFGGSQSRPEPAVNFLLIMRIVTCVIQNLPGRGGEAMSAVDFELILKIVSCILGNLGDVGSVEKIAEPTLAERHLTEIQTSRVLYPSRQP